MDQGGSEPAGDEPTVLFVAAGEADETIHSAVGRARGRAIEADDGVDAIKRLSGEPVDVVVVPAALPGVPIGAFVRRFDEGNPPIVLGDAGSIRGPAIRLDADVSVGALADRIDRAVAERQLGAELDRHDRLENAFVRIAGALGRDADRGVVERSLHDELDRTDAYRSILVGRYDADGGAVEFVEPFHRRVAVDEVGEFLGNDDASFVSRAIATGRAVTSDDQATAGVADADAGVGGARYTAVPLGAADGCHGVAILANAAGDAPDGTERTLLERLGRVVGLELAGGADPGDRIEGLMGVLAHELRNPLQLAGLSLEAVREGGEADDLDRLAEAIDRMDTIVDSTLAMARGEVREVEPVDVHEVALEVWHDARAPEAELTIARPASVEADPALLERLLSNLVRNAIDHGGASVSVRVGALPDDGGFFVEDDGPGVPAGRRESIFEWGHTSTPEGLGLGLGFVSEIADAHGWDVTVTEGREGGARFEVRTAEPAPPPRDELSALFDRGSDEFVFQDVGSR